MSRMSATYFTVRPTGNTWCAISFNKTLGVKASPMFLKGVLYRNYLKNTSDTKVKDLTLWNKPLGFSSMNNKSQISAMERGMLKLTPRVRSIIIGLILSDG